MASRERSKRAAALKATESIRKKLRDSHHPTTKQDGDEWSAIRTQQLNAQRLARMERMNVTALRDGRITHLRPRSKRIAAQEARSSPPFINHSPVAHQGRTSAPEYVNQTHFSAAETTRTSGELFRSSAAVGPARDVAQGGNSTRAHSLSRISQPYHSIAASAAAAHDDEEIGSDSDSSGSSEPVAVPQLSNKMKKRRKREKKKQLRKKRNADCCRNCNLVPHGELLQRFVCTSCKMETGLRKVLFYTQERKIFAEKHDLVKVVARLDAASLDFIMSIRNELQIPYNVRRDHIVLASCLTREKASDMLNHVCNFRLMFSVNKVFKFNNQLGKGLCLKLIATDPRLQQTLDRDRKQLCVLPQWPLSLVLGSYMESKSMKDAIKALRYDRFFLTTIVFDSVAILDSSGRHINGQKKTETTAQGEPERQIKSNEYEPVIEDKETSQVDDEEVSQVEELGASATGEQTQCKCTYIPHPSVLEAVVCCKCGKEQIPCDSIVRYNAIRRDFLRDRHSLKISAKLDERSRALMEPLHERSRALVEPGQNSEPIQKSQMNHAAVAAFASYDRITLVDGLMEWSIESTSLLKDIQQAIQLAPALEIVGLHYIPTSDSEKSGLQFLVIDLRPEPALDRVLVEAAQSSLVAQYSLRVKCGLVPASCDGGAKTITDIVNMLVGSSLYLDAGSVAPQSVA